MDGFVVNPRTQKEYDTLMQVYEYAGWKWQFENTKPTEKDVWKVHKKGTCIDAGISPFLLEEGRFLYSDLKNIRKENSAVISPNEFYLFQNISSSAIKELNFWFNKHKKRRKSKGSLLNRIFR